jgi:hypothetical protein
MHLENDHNVYILGAGFSQGAGLPLVSDFLVRMRDSHEWLVANGRKREAHAVNEVLKFRLEAASAAYWVNLDLENIEELFSLASASKGSMHELIQTAIAATLDFARHAAPETEQRMGIDQDSYVFTAKKCPSWVRNLNDSMIHPGASLSFGIRQYSYHVARLLGMFLDGRPKGRNSFVSFNYDTVLEEALRDLGVSYCYGFKPKTVNFDASAVAEVDDAAIPVLKLHGSVNWARRTGRGRALTVFSTYDDVLRSQLVPELIPPTWKKIFENQLEAIWETAVQCLNTATRIIIIGFSMPPTDVHFKFLMAAGLQKNVSLRQIIFVNPAPREELEPRVRKLLRETYVDSKLISFDGFGYLHTLTGGEGSISNFGRPAEKRVRIHI